MNHCRSSVLVILFYDLQHIAAVTIPILILEMDVDIKLPLC